MQVVILAGGFGTRLSEETIRIPKPLVEVNGKPLIQHVIDIFLSYGFDDFILCCGYKQNLIKKYFLDYKQINSDIDLDTQSNKVKLLNSKLKNFKMKIIDTGIGSNTGERILRIKDYIKGSFFLTYADGVGDINLNNLLKSHKKSKKLATVTTFNPVGRFGVLNIGKNNLVKSFSEKTDNVDTFINAGFFVLEKEIFSYLKYIKNPIWEKKPLENLAKDKQLNSYHHDSWWYAVDSLRDKVNLENFLNEHAQ